MEEMLTLNAVEARVLGSLIEKEMTTPEYYPLSLNALVNACNQKSSRDPVMQLSEGDVRSALFELEKLELVRVLVDARVSKFEHRAYDKLGRRRPEIALMALLLLRGPQTAAELRGRSERMYSFDDPSAVTDALQRLATREEPLVVQLERQPGARENRWMHLLGGSVENSMATATMTLPPANPLENRVAELERLVRELQEQLAALANPTSPNRREEPV